MKVQVSIDRCVIEIVQGDITDETTDAIVNAANPSLLGGGGVDGAIHHAAGPQLYEECRTLGGCATGDAKITRGYRLSSRYIIHAVGPVYRDGQHGEAGLLASACNRSLELAVEYKCASLSFPAISTGAYGYPMRDAARTMLETIVAFLRGRQEPKLVRLVLFDSPAFEAHRQALKSLRERENI